MWSEQGRETMFREVKRPVLVALLNVIVTTIGPCGHPQMDFLAAESQN